MNTTKLRTEADIKSQLAITLARIQRYTEREDNKTLDKLHRKYLREIIEAEQNRAIALEWVLGTIDGI